MTTSRARHPFEGVVVRYAHSELTGERLNIGVVVVCEGTRFAASRFLWSWSRITQAFPDADEVMLERVRTAFATRCASWMIDTAPPPRPAPIVLALVASVMSLEEGALHRSEVISGVTADPARTHRELFALYTGERPFVDPAPSPP